MNNISIISEVNKTISLKSIDNASLQYSIETNIPGNVQYENYILSISTNTTEVSLQRLFSGINSGIGDISTSISFYVVLACIAGFMIGMIYLLRGGRR